jgi:pimeloyl-ACP methyl ester carboxylesterase
MKSNSGKYLKLLENVDIVGFDASDGLMLYAVLSKPNKKATEAILHIHGLGGSFYGSNSIPEILSEAKRNGIGFMSVLTRGSYIVESFRYRSGNEELLAGSALERFEDSVYDIDGAVGLLRKMGFRKIFLEGHSTGCQKILYYMNSKKAKNSRAVAAISLLSPVDDYNYDLHVMGKEGFSKLTRIARKAKGKKLLISTDGTGHIDKLIGPERFLSTVDLSNPEAKALYYDGELNYVAGIKKPMFVAFGENDEFMKKMSAREATDILSRTYAGKRFESVILKNTGHTFRQSREELAKALIKFYSSL